MTEVYIIQVIDAQSLEKSFVFEKPITMVPIIMEFKNRDAAQRYLVKSELDPSKYYIPTQAFS